MAFGTSDDAEWLLQSPTSGVSEGPDDEVEIAVSVDVSGLEVGTYSAAIEISGGGIQNSPRSVPVTLTVRSTGYARERVSQDEQTEIVTPDSTVRLIVPENAVSSDVDIRVERLEVDSQPEPPGEWERVVLAFELDTLTPGGATRRPTTYNPGVELRLLLPEDDAGACAAGRVDVYRVVSGQWRSLEHRCETDEDGRVWAVSVLTRFSTFALVIDDAPPAGTICWSVSNILSWTVSQTPAARSAPPTRCSYGWRTCSGSGSTCPAGESECSIERGYLDRCSPPADDWARSPFVHPCVFGDSVRDSQ